MVKICEIGAGRGFELLRVKIGKVAEIFMFLSSTIDECSKFFIGSILYLIQDLECKK
jgi:hypothetical protein